MSSIYSHELYKQPRAPDTAMNSHNPTESAAKVRLDKWLWAARLFKTRALAKTAIEGGKVEIEGQKPKPGKEIAIGAVLKVRQGWDQRILTVTGLSEQRRSAPEAQQLYEESEASIREREKLAEQRKMQAANPTKKTGGCGRP